MSRTSGRRSGARDWRRAIPGGAQHLGGEELFLGGDGDAVVAAAGEELVAGDDLALVGFESEEGRLEAAGAAKGGRHEDCGEKEFLVGHVEPETRRLGGKSGLGGDL